MTSNVIDLGAIQKLLELIGGDPEDLQELIDDFEQETPTIVASMQAAVAAGDKTALRIAAHSLKANSQDMGAMALSRLCADLERASKDGPVDDPQAQVAAIEAELTVARTALADLALEEE